VTASFEDRALALLPAVHRERDARPDGEPGLLTSLIEVIAGQFALVDADLDQLYADLFIETCDAWVVPYIGDLVRVIPGAPESTDAVLTRAAVANAIALRRRKGTASILEQLARDVTEWPARAVEMFQNVVVTQNLQHVVADRGTTLALQPAAALERLDGPFDPAAHTLDVRRIGSRRGRHNLPNIAIFLWRDSASTHTWTDAARVDAWRFRFSPIGLDQALATRAEPESALTHQATALNVPTALTRRAMAASLDAYWGRGRSVAVRLPGATGRVPVADIVVCDLGDSAPGGQTWSNVNRLRPGQVGIDPALGRLAFADAQPRPPQVQFVTTSPGDLGATEAAQRPAAPAGQAVTQVARGGAGGAVTSLAAALATAGGSGAIAIADSATYTGDPSVVVPQGRSLWIGSASGAVPFIDTAGPWTVTLDEGAVVSIAGLLVNGPLVVRGRPDRVEIVDSTLVPGRHPAPDAGVTPPAGPSLVLDIDRDWQTDLVLDGCVTGPVCAPADGTTLSITDSIVDGLADGLGRMSAAVAPARVRPALRSLAPLGALALTPGSRSLRLILGTDPPRDVDLGSVPANAATAAALFDQALAGTGARAFAADDRIVVLGDGRPLAIAASPGSELASALGLSEAAAQTSAVLGGAPDLASAAAGGHLTVTDRRARDFAIGLAAGPADAASLASRLQAAVRAADAGLAGAVVGTLDGALVAVPGDASALTFAASSADRTTASSLGMVSPRPAIAADPAGTPGAALDLNRCTILGAVSVTAVGTISDSIVTGAIAVEQVQTGCIQYSWVPPGSVTPRLHECQPATPSTPPPAFVSTTYGTPGYARLRRAGATALLRGASTGFEMGALAHRQETQRDDNLRRGIDEFLRFGLEAGVFDGT
jgi:hypothetical protein